MAKKYPLCDESYRVVIHKYAHRDDYYTVYGTFAFGARGSNQKFLEGRSQFPDWKSAYKAGFRCIRVVIVQEDS